MFQLKGSASLNSLDLETAQEMKRMLKLYADSTSVTSYALHGKSGYFCGGVDLDWLSANRTRAPELYKALGDLYELIAMNTKPVVAIINGDVSGGGLGLTNTTFRVVTTGARFSIPEPSFGLVPDGPILKMLAKCDADSGLPVASYLALTGQPIGSNDMMLLGLATHQIHDSIIADEVIRSLASVSYEEGGLLQDNLKDLLNTYCMWYDHAGMDTATFNLMSERGGGEFLNTKKTTLWTPEVRAAMIDCFACKSVEETWQKLESLESHSNAWATAALAGMKASPALSILATKRLVLECASLTRQDASELTQRIASRLALAAPFGVVIENAAKGVRAAPTCLEDLKSAQSQMGELFEA
jgi:enoyl-CoA hydratase/carnithine racemase